MWLFYNSGLHAAAIRQADLAALLDLYRLLGGEQWIEKSSWDPTGVVDPCATRWYGVGCDDPCDALLDATVLPQGKTLQEAIRVPCRKGRITSIRLRANNLRGNLSRWSSVGELHELSHLDLSVNGRNLTGSLPSQLSTLRNLDFLDLSSNGLTGRLPDFGSVNGVAERRQLNRSVVVAPRAARAGSAGSAGAFDPRFDPANRPPFELDTANFAYNQLSGTIPSQLGLHTKLTLLDVGFNSLSGSLPTQLGELGASLEVLYGSNNRLDGTLPTQLGRLDRLRYLDAHRNDVSGTLPSASMGTLRSLRALQLFENSLSGSIPTQLGRATQLWSLRLNDNRLDGNLTLWRTLGDLYGLITLDLYNNSMSGELPKSLARLSKLRFLYVDQTHLRPLTLFYCRERLPLALHFGNKYNFKIVRDRYEEMASAECADPYDVNLAFNPLSAWGQYAD